jgi:transcriptional regulator with XRE-family HTH domain
MTHFQDLFIRNLRFFRTKKGISQLKFSELIDISPNYLNAVENGKNFPSPEVIQTISDTLDILPYQLFLEHPADLSSSTPEERLLLIQELTQVKQKCIKASEEIMQKYEG